MKAQKNTRIFYKDAVDIYSNLTPEDCQRLLIAHLSYNVGEPIDKYFQKGDPLIGIFIQIKRMIDINETKYQATCEKRAEAAKKAVEAKKLKNKQEESVTCFDNPINTQAKAHTDTLSNQVEEDIKEVVKEPDLTPIIQLFQDNNIKGDSFSQFQVMYPRLLNQAYEICPSMKQIEKAYNIAYE